MDELVIGTYEGYVLGYVQSADEESKLKQTFATQSHTGSVRCVTAAGKFLASGGTDDKIVIIDMKTRKEHTVLMHHDGTINSLNFTHGGTHLISGSDDGTLVVTRVGNWKIEKIWKKAHQGQPVIAVTVHPSDKLALSIGGDKTLRTWNLIKGRPAFTINLISKGINLPTGVMFAPDSVRFSLISQQSIDVWKINTAGIEKRISCSSRHSTVQWISDDKFAIGLDNGNILLLNVSDSNVKTLNAHKQRVKCMCYKDNTLYTASSSGEIKQWSLSDLNDLTAHRTTTASCRVTCMSLSQQNYLVKKELSDTEEKNQSDNENSEVENSDEEVSEEEPVKKKPLSFVAVSYDGEDDKEPPKKKRRKRNKNQSKKKNKS